MNFLTRVAGVSFYQDAVSKIKEDDQIALIREPQNVHDKNAIRLCVGEETIGYIPRKEAVSIAANMDAGQKLTATVVSTKRPNKTSPIGVLIEILFTGTPGETNIYRLNDESTISEEDNVLG